MHDLADPTHQMAPKYHTAADTADAASRTERPGDAADALAAMEAAALVTTSPSLHDGLRFARAVLAVPDEAEGLFLAALAADLTRRPFIRARTELAYGEWLRRQRRATECRPYLRAARDTFEALGTAPWMGVGGPCGRSQRSVRDDHGVDFLPRSSSMSLMAWALPEYSTARRPASRAPSTFSSLSSRNATWVGSTSRRAQTRA
jgi:hypothetical protein